MYVAPDRLATSIARFYRRVIYTSHEIIMKVHLRTSAPEGYAKVSQYLFPCCRYAKKPFSSGLGKVTVGKSGSGSSCALTLSKLGSPHRENAAFTIG